MNNPSLRILHVSDIHYGFPFVKEHLDAALELARSAPLTAIVASGDFSQRAREREFRQAARLLAAMREIAPVLTVPGNHDTAWWHAPFGIGNSEALHEGYRHWIASDLEPTLRLPGLSIVGLNSAWGMLPAALTWYPRDWRVKGGLSVEQLERAATELAASPDGDLRLLVVHHNVLRGRLSRRWGLARPRETLDLIAALPADVVATGHDHEERIEVVERSSGVFLLSAANTLSRRVRGHRPSALNIIEADEASIRVQAWVYADGRFVPGSAKAEMPRQHRG